MARALAVACALVVGCGDNDGRLARSDAAIAFDAGAPDAAQDTVCPRTPEPGQLGGTCAEDAECDSAGGAGDGWCIRGDALGMRFPDTGYCTRFCEVGQETCGDLTACFARGDFPGALCLPLCADCSFGPSDCGEGLACRSQVGEGKIRAPVCMPGDEKARIGAPCTSIAQCSYDGLCEPDQSGTSGMCTAHNCQPEFDCGHLEDAACVDPDGSGGAPSYCIDVCETIDECVTEDGQRCVEGGPLIGRHCRHSEVGDPCESDGECGRPPWYCTDPGGTCAF